MRTNCFLLILLLTHSLLMGQVQEKPNFALATHPMMVMEYSDNSIEVHIRISVENQLSTGSFCADKHIYIEDISSRKTKMLVKADGIPYCPDQYVFKEVGERLEFQLYFPPFAEKVRYINLVEDCQDYCFTIYGLIVDPSLNQTINDGYNAFNAGDYVTALEFFSRSVNSSKDYPYGHLIFNLLQVHAKLNHMDQARELYQKIKTSDFTDRDFILDKLKKEPYYFKLQEKTESSNDSN